MRVASPVPGRGAELPRGHRQRHQLAEKSQRGAARSNWIAKEAAGAVAEDPVAHAQDLQRERTVNQLTASPAARRSTGCTREMTPRNGGVLAGQALGAIMPKSGDSVTGVPCRGHLGGDKDEQP
jgi:hypothetical protein